MKIDSSIIGMESVRRYTSSSLTVSRLSMEFYGKLAKGKGGPKSAITYDGEENGSRDESVGKNGKAGKADKTESMPEWQDRFQISLKRPQFTRSPSTLFRIRQQSMRYIFDILFGNKKGIWNNQPNEMWGNQGVNNQNGGDLWNMGQFNKGMQGQSVGVFSINYEEHSWFMEKESVSFSTTGIVKTADGREIHFDLSIGMSREFQEYYGANLDVGAIQMCDPLVINLGTEDSQSYVASLADQKFFFDIDADGVMDEISKLGMGSGYLALDNNGDGIINDGSELFGTKSGNGFADLALHDDDGNGWIDENDAIWDKLQIWVMGENGESILYRLSEKGIGAICLQHISTDFQLRSETEPTGAIRKTGVFLYENGNVGTVQHLDLVKYNQQA